MHISRLSRWTAITSRVQGVANRIALRQLILAVLLASGVAPAFGASVGTGGPPALLGPASASDVARFNQSTHLPEPALVRQQPVSVDITRLNPSTGAPASITVNLLANSRSH
jgi:hypothetical protein